MIKEDTFQWIYIEVVRTLPTFMFDYLCIGVCDIFGVRNFKLCLEWGRVFEKQYVVVSQLASTTSWIVSAI